MKTETLGSAPRDRMGTPRPRTLGSIAGLLGVGCCVYPVVLVLFGFASATEAIALGKNLYGRWGWTFKLAGGALAATGIVVHLRRRGECTIQGARRNQGFILRVALAGVGTYWLVYGVTKALATWGTGPAKG